MITAEQVREWLSEICGDIMIPGMPRNGCRRLADHINAEIALAVAGEVRERERAARLDEARMWNERTGYDEDDGQPYTWCKRRIAELEAQQEKREG